MGLFAEAQPAWAAANVPTFPIDGVRKRPAVKNFLRGGLLASREWASRYVDADSFGFACGRRAGVVVVDLDTEDAAVRREMVARHGEPRVEAETHSGKRHLYYRANGERRRIRPYGPDLPVDVLGEGGFAVAPPSLGKSGAYRFIRGGLEDLCNLVPMLNPPSAPIAADKAVIAGTKLIPGNRNNELFVAAMKAARDCSDEAALLVYVEALNRAGSSPLPAGEVREVVSKAWGYEARGANFAGVGKHMVISHDQFDRLSAQGQVGQDALFLRADLSRVNHSAAAFFCANSMRERLGWPLRRLQAARDCLLRLGEMIEVRPPSSVRGPAVYRWPHVAAKAAIAEMALLDRGERQAGG